MSDRDKPGRCPNRECGGERVRIVRSGGPGVEWPKTYPVCGDCGMSGPPADGTDAKARDLAVRLWNALPRDAEPAGVARGEL